MARFSQPQHPFRQGGPVRAFFGTLFGKSTPVEEQPPYANYYTKGAVPGTTFHSTWEKNPNRLHAPPRDLIPDETVAVQDRANTRVQRKTIFPMQRYFNHKQEVPVPPTLIPSIGHQAPILMYKRGWTQQYDPELDGHRHTLQAAAPVVLLSRPIMGKTYQDVGARSPIKAKAPKARG